MIRLDDKSDWNRWTLERRADGVILVRVPSQRAATAQNGTAERLPDAVFSFRDGDPQYALWAERLAMREAGAT